MAEKKRKTQTKQEEEYVLTDNREDGSQLSGEYTPTKAMPPSKELLPPRE